MTKPKPTYCCPVLELVVKRQAKRGIRWGLMVNFKTGRSRDELIIEFPKAKDRKEPHASSTYSPLNFCPFCGKRLTGARVAKKSVAA